MALPLGELSPQVTKTCARGTSSACEGASIFPLDVAVIALSVLSSLGHLSHREAKGARTETVLRPSDFRAARALRGSRKTVNGAYLYRYAPFLVPIYDALALLWESCHHQVTERSLAPAGRHLPAKVPAFSDWTLPLFALSVLAALGHLSTGRQRECRDGNRLRPSDFRAARALRVAVKQ